jgi:putative transposase
MRIHQASRGTSGALRVQVALRARGLLCGHNRVARLMRQAGGVGCHRRRPVRVPTTRGDPAMTRAPDLVQRAFRAPAPDRLWVADITSLPTEQDGVLFLAVLRDAWSRRVVGWSLRDHLRTDLGLAALEMAVWNRRPKAGVIHHSDHGCQYTSVLFGARCAAAGSRSSRGSVADCFDNALVERLFATLECERLAHHRFQTHEEARAAVFDWIERCYNRQRRHSALGYVAPAVYEHPVTTPTPGAA